MTYSAFVSIGEQTLAILPGAQPTKDKAEAQVSAFMRELAKLPGGTQLFAGWVEPD